jgi:hypothetical protein
VYLRLLTSPFAHCRHPGDRALALAVFGFVIDQQPKEKPMADNGTDERTAAQRFEDYNPYAAAAVAEKNVAQAQLQATLAAAFALDRLRSEIHFGLKGRSK